MSNTSKKQSFMSGAAMLAASVAIVKIIGAVYKIPFGNIVGSEGQTYFNVAYNIYNMLLTISTAGDLPHLHLAVLRLRPGGVPAHVLLGGASGGVHERAPGVLAHPGPGPVGLLRVSPLLHAGLYPGPGGYDAIRRVPGH